MITRSGLETEKFDDELNGLLDALERRNIHGVVVVFARHHGGELELGVATARRTGAVELAFLRKAAAEAIKAERAARGELPQ